MMRVFTLHKTHTLIHTRASNSPSSIKTNILKRVNRVKFIQYTLNVFDKIWSVSVEGLKKIWGYLIVRSLKFGLIITIKTNAKHQLLIVFHWFDTACFFFCCCCCCIEFYTFLLIFLLSLLSITIIAVCLAGCYTGSFYFNNI